ncbi:Gfo/Idh/MocA family protein [Staphylococcus kloosii]|jgi:predicted dehydrogenase|uniref:NADH-dependent dehydrogenase n=1 Tax=Staphylococcus kloosii TaxID=29384 RepID=A0ABQ0XNR7_9STAP|nr:Gfo/Idh/MocA family oxidoreductase [Staphylococcus kloosii]AVQ36941.1 gfo/Idh/MocA family oxidoreductase [Staphylococcus kloosii]PNZ07052.1 gfo/Idh/MocA family oxidoreductase [Staphylococcus kloosii]PTJ80547.1 gfo/Idh/MocA family oxidoreductase [Staphylococcus kloosii]SUM50042.1 NADH-dependent dehydrogenase [Staphylococcus kloosii]GEP83056.1 NADH-dependent dehydrogenase [Staphylococcus kloosii]
MKKLKMGIIGVGGIAQGRHIPTFKELEDQVEIIGVQDINNELAQTVAHKFDIPNVYESYEEMFDDIDAVTICTPNKFHCDITVSALTAGVHVFCEKPMAMKVDECQRMVQAAKQSNKLLAIGYHYRFTDAAISSKLAVDDNIIGDALVIRVQALRRRKVPGWGVFTNKSLQGGGSLIDYGCHFLDLALWLLGEVHPVNVLGKTYNRLSKIPNQLNEWGVINHQTFDVDDHVTSFITFDDGSSMQFECSWSANIKEDKMHISISGVDGGLNVYPFETYAPKYGTFVTETAEAEHNEHVAARRQALNFVNSCLGDEQLIVQPEEALRVNAIIEAIYQSDERGEAINLNK